MDRWRKVAQNYIFSIGELPPLDPQPPLPLVVDNYYPLHDLAFDGDHEEMKIQFKDHRTESERQISRKDKKGRTPLHYAALTENLEGGELCVQALIEFHQTVESVPDAEEEIDSIIPRQQRNKLQFQNLFHNKVAQRHKTPHRAASVIGNLRVKTDIAHRTKKFINTKDKDRETALSLAAKNENPKIVEYLLQHSANVLSTCGIGNDKELTLELIYTNTPSAVTALLDQSVTFDYEDKDKENITVERKYILDLSAVVGNSESLGEVFTESELLHSVNDNAHDSRNRVLEHPLVQLFITKKTEKMKYFFWISLVFHIMWIGLYIWLVVDVYADCCDCTNISRNITCYRYPFENWAKHKGKNETEIEKLNAIFISSLKKNRRVIVRPILILLLSIVVLSKEIYKIIFLKLSYVAVKNLFIWGFFVILVATGWPNREEVTLFIRQFQLAAFGIIIGGQIILQRVTKHTYLAIYLKVLIKQFERFLATLPLFFVIMLTFATSLGMLYPDIHLSTSSSFYNFRDSLMRIFEAITASKVEWTSLYKDSSDQNFKFAGLIMYCVFYVIIILLLFRMLLGFVVADTKRIQDEYQVESISDDLEFIFIIESFFFFGFFSKVCDRVRVLNKFREFFSLSRLVKGTRDLKVKISEKAIPSTLRKDIRELASKNLLKKKKETKEKSIIVAPPLERRPSLP